MMPPFASWVHSLQRLHQSHVLPSPGCHTLLSLLLLLLLLFIVIIITNTVIVIIIIITQTAGLPSSPWPSR